MLSGGRPGVWHTEPYAERHAGLITCEDGPGNQLLLWRCGDTAYIAKDKVRRIRVHVTIFSQNGFPASKYDRLALGKGLENQSPKQASWQLDFLNENAVGNPIATPLNMGSRLSNASSGFSV
jgi:hypothetical protein